MATVPPPLGFIEPPGEVGGIGGIAGVVGAVASAVAATFDLINRFLHPPGAPGADNWGAANNFIGPAPDEGGGYWPGVPNGVGYWILKGRIKQKGGDIFNIQQNTPIPVTYSMIGPYKRQLKHPEYSNYHSLDWDAFGPNGESTGYSLIAATGLIWMFSIEYPGPWVIEEMEWTLLDDGTNNFIDPVIVPPPERKAPPIIDPPTFPELPPPVPSPGPGPPLPNPSPDPGPNPTPNPNSPPFTNPGPGEPQRNPNPQPSPGFFPTTPQFFPTPIPSNPIQTNPNGSPQKGPIAAPKQTPTDSHVVGDRIINQPGPQPSLDGIAKEVGRIESKLASVMKSAPLKDPLEWDEIIAILRLLKDLFDGITDNEPQSAYQITSPCELDDQEQRIVFASTIAASTDKFGAIINRINAVADLLQHSKNLKQPLCPGQRFPVSGQAVTVNFTQID